MRRGTTAIGVMRCGNHFPDLPQVEHPWKFTAGRLPIAVSRRRSSGKTGARGPVGKNGKPGPAGEAGPAGSLRVVDK